MKPNLAFLFVSLLLSGCETHGPDGSLRRHCFGYTVVTIPKSAPERPAFYIRDVANVGLAAGGGAVGFGYNRTKDVSLPPDSAIYLEVETDAQFEQARKLTNRNLRRHMHHKEDDQNRRTRKALCFVALFFVVTLTGCQHYNAINFVTNTQVGAKVGVNAEKIPEIQVGYNRQEAARVPVYLMTTKDGLSSSPPAINAILSQAGKKIGGRQSQPMGATQR